MFLFVLSGDSMEIMRFYKQKRILHKYVHYMYDLLADGRFYYLQRASKIKDLPKNYSRADGPVRYFERMYHCADTLEGYFDPVTGDHHLTRGWFCGDRICPVCAIKKSLWEYSKLTWQMEHFQTEYTYYFLTLTLPNNQDGFRDEIDLMASILLELGDFLGMDRHKGALRFCEGMYGSYEITKSGFGWHPHLHLVLAFPTKYVAKTNTVKKIINGKERVFENGLVLRHGKRELRLSQDLIMDKYIELIQRRTHKYDEILEEKRFLNIGFQPCYNIESGVNEMTKYLIDFESIESADDLYIYMRDSYNLRQRVRRGIFRWTPELKQAHRDFLDELKSNEINVLSNSGNESVIKGRFKWVHNSYIVFNYTKKIFNVEFSDKQRLATVLQFWELYPVYDARGKPVGYKVNRLPDRVVAGSYVDINDTVYEYDQESLF